jgi:ATP synthase protein I
MADSGHNGDRYETRLGREVGRKAQRRLVGWAVAIPTLIGIGIGLWLDERYAQGRVSWTLTFLIIGIAAGCLNAWYWVRQETRDE